MTVVYSQVRRQSIVNDSKSAVSQLLLKWWMKVKAFETPIFTDAATFHVSGKVNQFKFRIWIPSLDKIFLEINVI